MFNDPAGFAWENIFLILFVFFCTWNHFLIFLYCCQFCWTFTIFELHLFVSRRNPFIKKQIYQIRSLDLDQNVCSKNWFSIVMDLANKQFSRKTFLPISRNVMPKKILKMCLIFKFWSRWMSIRSHSRQKPWKKMFFLHEMYGTGAANVH